MRRTVLFFAWAQYDAAETEFWRELRRSLQSHGLHLLLVSPNTPPAGFDVDHLPFVPTIDALWTGHDAAPVSLEALGLDPDTLLAREEEWSGPTVVSAVRTLRKQALSAIATDVLRMLSVVRPVCAVIWNGQHVPEMILDAALRIGGVPVLYAERAPVPRSLFVDEQGLATASTVAAEPVWPVPEERWLRRAADLSERVAAGMTWWSQPPNKGAESVRRQLGIPDDRCVVLFAGQVDEDTQRFLFSPIFADNLDAWQWLLHALAGRGDVFVLGKHHPRAMMPPEAYRRVLERSAVPGVWTADISIDDALCAADRVVAVNSTVLYEALARDLPVLAMGNWLLTGRGVAHEVRDRDDSAVVGAWLADDAAAERRQRWQECLGYLASRSIYAFDEEAVRLGSLGAHDLAAKLSGIAAASPWHPPLSVQRQMLGAVSKPPWSNPGDTVDDFPQLPRRWRDANALRHCVLQARAAARRGRRVVIWGAGRAGGIVQGLLRDAGVMTGAFVSSDAAPGERDGIPVIVPARLETASVRDFVLVASVGAPDIVPQLAGRGFRDGDDVMTIDCERLLDLTTPVVQSPR